MPPTGVRPLAFGIEERHALGPAALDERLAQTPGPWVVDERSGDVVASPMGMLMRTSGTTVTLGGANPGGLRYHVRLDDERVTPARMGNDDPPLESLKLDWRPFPPTFLESTRRSLANLIAAARATGHPVSLCDRFGVALDVPGD